MVKFAPLFAIVEAQLAAYRARRDAIELAWSESNSNIPPVMDSNGRYHAPCDGYVIPNAHCTDYNRDYSDVMFGKGEFLPIPIYDESTFGHETVEYSHKTKVRATVQAIQELAGANLPLEVTHGKTWNQAGVEVAYAYINGHWKTLVEEAAKILAQSLETVSNEPEVYMEEGRHTVKGTIAFIKSYYDATYGALTKMMVTTEAGHKLFGTCPSCVPSDAQGKVVQFTATFSRGKNGMTFYKRPSKVVLN